MPRKKSQKQKEEPKKDQTKPEEDEKSLTTAPDEVEGSVEKDKKDEPSEEAKPESGTTDETDKSEEEIAAVDTDTNPESETAEEIKEEPKELTEEDIITILKTFTGVGQVMAQRIIKAGFDSREKLSTIAIDDLKKIRGIGHTLAENVSSGMENAIKKFDAPEPSETEKAKETGPGITDKAMGLIKGTISKITGFFKGKKPKGTAEDDSSEEKDKLEPGSDGQIKPDRSDQTESGPEELYPEVGADSSKPEHDTSSEPVTVEDGDTTTETQPEPEPAKEPEPEPKPEPEPEPEPVKEPEPKFNFNDASGLFQWFELTPNLRNDSGKLVFKAGYNNLNELKEAVVDDLVLISGIDKQEAEIICQELNNL
jgi:ribosomal protein S13